MITIRIGNITATLNDRTWSSGSAPIRRMLQAATDGLSIHGGTPNVERAIVDALSATLPLHLVSGTESAAGDVPAGVFF